MTINPKDADPDLPYEVTTGGERLAAQRVDPNDELPWRVMLGREWPSWREDSEVSDLVPLVPARNVTRDEHDEKDRERIYKLVAEYREMWGKQLRRAERAEADLACRNEELAEAEGEIAELTKARDGWKASAEATAKDYSGAESRVSKLIAERDELQAKLGAVELENKALLEDRNFKAKQPANRPTLDREAVREVVGKHCGDMGSYYAGLLVDEIMALAPAAEGWPEWLGPRVDPDECNADSKFVSGAYSVNELREHVHYHVRMAGEAEAAARARKAMNAEQAETDDEDQRIEELSDLLADADARYEGAAGPEDGNYYKFLAEAAHRAGWTPPESEEK